MFAALVLASLSLLAPNAPPAQAAAAPAVAARPAVLERVAVCGASLSAGFGLSSEAARRIGFADVLDALLVADAGEMLASTSIWTFLDPEGSSTKAVDTLLASEPTLLVGVDFLFWFGYGDRRDVAGHLARFEKGLALLDRFECPIVLGDLPDMSAATKAESPMLRADQVPSAEALDAMNARLAAWAAERPRVHVLPLADFVRRMNAGERLEVRGNAWEKEAWERMMQKDELHPSLEGAIAVGLIALDALVRARELDESMVSWDVEAALAALAPAPAPAEAR